DCGHIWNTWSYRHFYLGKVYRGLNERKSLHGRRSGSEGVFIFVCNFSRKSEKISQSMTLK
ncbi:MAG: hypothetical protein J6N22_00215, partial [Schwartzia sp.]|nr:hypothetical protein [Schwartzia sp. (in: firmicutes)]